MTTDFTSINDAATQSPRVKNPLLGASDVKESAASVNQGSAAESPQSKAERLRAKAAKYLRQAKIEECRQRKAALRQTSASRKADTRLKIFLGAALLHRASGDYGKALAAVVAELTPRDRATCERLLQLAPKPSAPING